jgi:DNA-binding CsgD family transcriptional regulator
MPIYSELPNYAGVTLPVSHQSENQVISPMHAVLEHLLHQGSCITWILDRQKAQFTFISQNVERILGYPTELWIRKGTAFLREKMHPADLIRTEKQRKQGDEQLQLLGHERENFRLKTQYRLQRSDGRYVLLFEQSTCLHTNHLGQVTHLLGIVSDLTHWSAASSFSTPLLLVEAELSQPAVPTQKSLRPKIKLTKREWEVVQLLAEGNSSKTIAHRLGISFHTVNKHRQNLIEKTAAKNTGELVQRALSQGVI